MKKITTILAICSLSAASFADVNPSQNENELEFETPSLSSTILAPINDFIENYTPAALELNTEAFWKGAASVALIAITYAYISNRNAQANLARVHSMIEIIKSHDLDILNGMKNKANDAINASANAASCVIRDLQKTDLSPEKFLNMFKELSAKDVYNSVLAAGQEVLNKS
jgi:hypothetical protein